MYIITKKQDNVINFISETLDHQSNGNLLINNGTLAIACVNEVTVNEIDNVPSEVKEEKYCYTEEKGFYKNENYVEYYSLEEQVSALQDMVNEIILGGLE